MVKDISNSDDVIDSRDIIERIEELEDKEQAIADAKADLENADGEDDRESAEDALEDAELDFDDDERNELKVLRELRDEAEGYSGDWRHGAALIRESYFTEYCEQLCRDIGDLPDDIPSYLEIDWEKTAENIRQDYTAVEFDGVTYLIR